MAEEALADSGEVSEVSEGTNEVSEGINIDEAAAGIASDLFPSEKEKEPVEEFDVVEEIVEEVVEEEPEEVVAEPEEEKLELPASWKKDMQEKWDSIDTETQQYFLQREKQMAEGLEKDRGDANLGRVMRDVMSPYSEMLKSQGIDESAMVRNLMNAHYKITTADQSGKADLIKQLPQ